jgi:hypothetical protein
MLGSVNEEVDESALAISNKLEIVGRSKGEVTANGLKGLVLLLL